MSQRVKLGDVAEQIKDKINKDNTSLEYYIGGEHIESGRIVINKKAPLKGSTVGPAFHMHFMPGDVLLMSRNPHLCKASMVDFEGICSDVSYVVRTKDESVFTQRLLPFVVQTKAFWRFAEENKRGGMPFFLNWKDFAEFEFNLPDPSEQEKIADLLWAAENTKEAYEAQVALTDELVKSQFIEVSQKWKDTAKYEPLASYIKKITYGFTNPMPDTEEGPWKITAKDIVDGTINYETARKTSKDAYDALTDKSRPEIGDVLLTKDGTLGRTALVEDSGICINQSVAAIRCNDRIIPEFLVSMLRMPEYQEKMLADAGGVTVKHLYITRVDKMPVLVPDVDAQRRWIEFINQSDKSKFELKQSIEKVEAIIKSLSEKTFA